MGKRYNFKKEETTRVCDCPGCKEAGLYRAPKNKSLTDYFWFCLKHVQEYNKRWDFLEGLSPQDIEEHIQHDTIWQRPTWKLGENFTTPKAKFSNTGFETADLGAEGKYSPPPKFKREKKFVEAMTFFKLEFPLTEKALKKQYKVLAKKYHPDVNADKDAHKMFQKLQNYYQYLLKKL